MRKKSIFTGILIYTRGLKYFKSTFKLIQSTYQLSNGWLSKNCYAYASATFFYLILYGLRVLGDDFIYYSFGFFMPLKNIQTIKKKE